MGSVVTALPPVGCWALGADARALAERLLAEARHQGLRVAWLGAEAGFLSNLSVQENLRMMYDWDLARTGDFSAALLGALTALHISMPAWLQQRPSQLLDSQLHYARLLRVLLLRPEVLVLQPLSLAQADAVLSQPLVSRFTTARLLLLADPVTHWPAWPLPDILPVSTEENPA
jgi:hypothetical protein